MQVCQKCGSDRIISYSGKTSDMNHFMLMSTEKELDGYVPGDLGIGSGDYIEFDFCLECGQIQGTWPKEQTEIEQEDEDEE